MAWRTRGSNAKRCKEMQRDAKSMLPQLPQLTAILAILAVLAILYFALTYLDFNLFNVLLPKTWVDAGCSGGVAGKGCWPLEDHLCSLASPDGFEDIRTRSSKSLVTACNLGQATTSSAQSGSFGPECILSPARLALALAQVLYSWQLGKDMFQSSGGESIRLALGVSLPWPWICNADWHLFLNVFDAFCSSFCPSFLFSCVLLLRAFTVWKGTCSRCHGYWSI